MAKQDPLKNLAKIEKLLPIAILAANRKAGLATEGRSKERAPVDTGALRESGVSNTQLIPGGVKTTVSFDKPYAAVQHEREDFNHPKGGEAKYLDTAFKEVAGQFTDMIADEVKKVL